MSPIKGSCLCGCMNYMIHTEPLFMANCHCTSCQKTSGSAFSAILGVPESDFQIEGEVLKSYESLGDSGQPIIRHFCGNCGTLLFANGEVSPGVLYVRAGTVDTDLEFTPGANVYWRDHKDWLPAETPCFDTMPPPQTEG